VQKGSRIRSSGNAEFEELPALAAKGDYEEWRKGILQPGLQSPILGTFHSPGLRMFSQPNENEARVRIRPPEAAEKQGMRLVEGLRKKYSPKRSALQERIRRQSRLWPGSRSR